MVDGHEILLQARPPQLVVAALSAARSSPHLAYEGRGQQEPGPGGGGQRRPLQMRQRRPAGAAICNASRRRTMRQVQGEQGRSLRRGETKVSRC